jgi:hypothetical protein
MIWPVLIMAVGLGLTLVGLVFTFKREPPALSSEIDWGISDEEMQKMSAMPIEELRKAGEKAVQKEQRKIILSTSGVRLLILGAALQFIGTVWQVVWLASRG